MHKIYRHLILGYFMLVVASPVFSFSEIEQTIKDINVDAKRLELHLTNLAEFGKTSDGGVHRVAFSDEDIAARKYILTLMEAAGLDVRIDAAGNILGRCEGSDNSLPPIMSGSHIDTVPHGGKYDGAVGVLSAIECVQVFIENKVQTRHPLEVIVFTDEEGGLVGSRAMNGTLTSEALTEKSHSGKTVQEGIKALGGDPGNLGSVQRLMGDIKAFLEIHIEQGRILEMKDIDIGVVEGIVGIAWWSVTIEGYANHAGTTPMNMRQDALLAAAQLILTVNRVVTSVEGSQVGTVGRINAEPGAPNVIPGKVVMSLELRDLSADKIQSLYRTIEEEAVRISKKTATQITFDPIDAMAVPAPTDPVIRRQIAESAEELGLTIHFMPSGAGHDAQDMAKIVPTGMIFIPSVGGVSHSPNEFSHMSDVVNGANVLLKTILKIDQQR
ncbi:MAG: Zn-dependent hydrolase [Candidatus Aminicenantes bacterium]|nr:Zn-dependent hydrolase [Candidatus Aminicenantes bacterium]